MNKFLSKPEDIFIIFCIIFGFLFLMINPPFQTSDETSHMYRMYGFSEGIYNFTKRPLSFAKGIYAGLYLPNNLVGVSQFNSRLWCDTTQKAHIYQTQKLLKVSLDKNVKVFCAFTPPIYTPISYFPGFIILWIMKIFNVAPLVMMYILRFCTLLTYIAMIYYAIKITPVHKWLFLSAAIVPEAIYFGSSISTDPIVTGFAFLTTAYALKLTFDDKIKTIQKKNYITLALLCLLLNICKFPYLVLSLLILIIPDKKFEHLKTKYIWLGSILFAGIIIDSALILEHTIALQGVTMSIDGNINSLSIVDCLKIVFFMPLKTLNLLFTNFISNGYYYLKGVFGFFGWSDTEVPPWVIFSYLGLMILSVFIRNEDEKEVDITLKDKSIFFAIFILMTLITAFACFLSFGTLSGGELVIPQGRFFQGRYWIPLIPIVFMIFSSKKFNLKKDWLKHLILAIFVFLLLVCTIVILARYYV